MEMTHTINVAFDLVLNMAPVTGQTLGAETHVCFTYDLKLVAETNDEALKVVATEFLQTEL